ncbi:RidA family protein [Ignatzschineria sp. RMDPL8A]|uniref:RidA family protein n=1 Tax=Ignatzschineria sp. RMDPL8A TaxID=2999236 RepID=UPI0016906143|nr:RidA family protein [Ignatzschineria sp. RMDPL8A]MDG9729368.1 RidA family protein [Ignatzschineria sp. RMDPL8A]NLD09520.1 RidA family protein [Xanthomonadaceae bacterium]
MKKIIHTDNAPKAVGPYSQANALGNLVFTSGQIPLDPATMQVVEGDVKAQARQTLLNLKAVLEEAGAGFDSVLKTTCFLDDIKDFAAFNEVYAEFFGSENTPARSCFEVGKLPMGVLVEVEAIAYVK